MPAESAPAPPAAVGPSPWTVHETQTMMEAYLGAFLARGEFDHFFADDVVFSIEGTPQRAEGRAAVRQALLFLHAVAFDARPELKTLLAGRNTAVMEADFVGTHVAEYAGVPATGRSVRVPYSTVYDVRGGKLCALRAYMDTGALYRQLTA